MSWSKSKGEQLDLLDATATASTDPIPIEEPSTDALDVDEPPRLTSYADDVHAVVGQPLFVPIERLHEDPDNQRTEFPQARLDELAEDIWQRGILQPIIVHPADASGNYRIHFGAMRLHAAKRAGLQHVPVAVRDAPADPYAQVAENQRRCPLEPLELARLIKGRSDAGDSNATIARQLGMDLTTVAHHLALLDLPAELDEALKAGRCTSPRTLYELSRLHAEQPEQVNALVTGGDEITRSAVAALRAASTPTGAPSAAVARHSTSLIEQANAACTRLEVLVVRVKKSELAEVRLELTALGHRIADLADRLG